jgi:endogenous inhibitor of DNA gyrase (YacG/DUF329 family)
MIDLGAWANEEYRLAVADENPAPADSVPD